MKKKTEEPKGIGAQLVLNDITETPKSRVLGFNLSVPPTQYDDEGKEVQQPDGAVSNAYLSLTIAGDVDVAVGDKFILGLIPADKE